MFFQKTRKIFVFKLLKRNIALYHFCLAPSNTSRQRWVNCTKPAVDWREKRFFMFGRLTMGIKAILEIIVVITRFFLNLQITRFLHYSTEAGQIHVVTLMQMQVFFFLLQKYP